MVPSTTSVSSPPMMPPRATGRFPSVMTSIEGSRARSVPSRVTRRSPSRARRTPTRPVPRRSRSNECSGCPVSRRTKLVTSTTLLMERWPTASRRSTSQAGDGPTVTPRMIRARYRGQSAASSTSTVTADGAASPASGTTTSGRRRAVPERAAISRASPRWLMQSPRFAVMSTSSTVSPAPRRSPRGVPGSPSASSRIPSCSSPRPSSRVEQSMPWLVTPRILLFRILKSSPRTVPMGASAVTRPARALGAPHTISRISPSPASTRHTCSRSALGWGPASRMRATRTPSGTAPAVSMRSTGSPAMVRRWASSSRSSGRST